ncbi:MAG: hypothetical protein ABIP94_09575 [Planctomycetota bacterium]
MQTSHLFCALLLAAVPLTGQAVLQVPFGYAQIGTAIASAQPGDIIEVDSGTYPPFVCNKGVSIVARLGAQVLVSSLAVLSYAPTEFVVPSGAMAKVVGLQFVNLNPFAPMETRVLGGSVAFEDCSFEAPFIGIFGAYQGLRISNSRVWLRTCRCMGYIAHPPFTVNGGSLPCVGMSVEQSFVAAVDCEFVGGKLLGDGGVGAGDGVQATNSSLHLVRCAVTGGASASLGCFYPNGHGLQVFSGIGTWLVDCTIRGGSYPGCLSGGDALRNNGTVPVLLTRVTTIPGVGTMQSGSAIVGPTQADTALGLAGPTVGARLGTPYRIDYQTTANTLLLLFFSDHLFVLPPMATVEPTWVPIGAPFLGFLVSDPSGLGTFQTTIPNAPALRFASLWIHAAAWTGPPLHAAAPIGGMLR